MRNLRSISLSTDYRTGSSDPAANFYRPCLKNATSYDRAVGYFRSSVFLINGDEIISFARNGGKIRLICSPSLHETDSRIINLSYEEREKLISNSLLAEIDEMLGALDYEYQIKILATLIACNAMDVHLAIRNDGNGIYHEKIGIFSDSSGNMVSFIGSANETWSAWHTMGNFESIEVFCSWDSQLDATRVARHKRDFDRLWNNDMPGIQVYHFPQAAKSKLLTAAHSDPESIVGSPKQRKKPLPHQADALDAWKARGKKGIFEHATGSGKTFTAITAIRDHVEGGLPALILVPSQLLLEQWANEIKDEMPEATVLIAGGGHNSWRDGVTLKGMTSPLPMPDSRIIVATMQTAATSTFRSKVFGGDHLLLVADEVHQIGSPYNARAMEIKSGSRLGLSATPKRYGDPEGTAAIFDYFNGIVPPPFTLQDAIQSGRLVQYKYFPHIIHLSAEEAHEWKEFSDRIKLEIARSKRNEDGSVTLSDKVKMLLIQRSKISKKARGKVSLAVAVISKNYSSGQRWLIYCEDTDQLNSVKSALSKRGLSPVEYHSSMQSDRKATLQWFTDVGGIMVSIKCLDEGVDIPAVDHALILASSQNPRQFIQRRGRVLRQSPGKPHAVIHDAIVAPLSLDSEPDQFALLKSELLRAIEFSNHALNKSAAIELNGLAARLGYETQAISDAGVEDEEEGGPDDRIG